MMCSRETLVSWQWMVVVELSCHGGGGVVSCYLMCGHTRVVLKDFCYLMCGHTCASERFLLYVIQDVQ